ncbi:MAG: hypothetical protein SNH79_02610 [Rikenellaceae bacterium]
MDRNIGSRGTGYQETAGNIHYQFGRKDPFPHSSATIYTSSGSTTIGAGTSTTGVTTATAVLNPTTFYYATSSSYPNWCTEARATTYIWNDSQVLSAESYDGKKSIFDPSPAGFSNAIYPETAIHPQHRQSVKTQPQKNR